MSKKKVFALVSKDAMCRDYLHHYGILPGQFETPNIDELVEKGTIFNHYYCAAPSTVMAFYSMCTGLFAHETDFQLYEKCHKRIEGKTVFTEAKQYGYDEFHCMWDEDWDAFLDYYDYFREDVIIHSYKDFRAHVGVHKKGAGIIQNDEEKSIKTLRMIEEEIKSILDTTKSVFLWIHFPHVISGRSGYGSDIDLFDRYIGMIRKYVPDSCIAITADHGNMNGHKGKLAYGFDVNESSACIPLIVPRVDNLRVCNDLVSAVDLFAILYRGEIVKRDYLYCDSAYRAQEHRKLAIIHGHYKYIYNKKDNSEELYDLLYDPTERLSLINDKLFDVDRKIYVNISEEYYYPFWSELLKERLLLRTEKNRIWRDGSFIVILKSRVKELIKPFYMKFLRIIGR